MINRLNLEG